MHTTNYNFNFLLTAFYTKLYKPFDIIGLDSRTRHIYGNCNADVTTKAVSMYEPSDCLGSPHTHLYSLTVSKVMNKWPNFNYTLVSREFYANIRSELSLIDKGQFLPSGSILGVAFEALAFYFLEVCFFMFPRRFPIF